MGYALPSFPPSPSTSSYSPMPGRHSVCPNNGTTAPTRSIPSPKSTATPALHPTACKAYPPFRSFGSPFPSSKSTHPSPTTSLYHFSIKSLFYYPKSIPIPLSVPSIPSSDSVPISLFYGLLRIGLIPVFSHGFLCSVRWETALRGTFYPNALSCPK